MMDLEQGKRRGSGSSRNVYIDCRKERLVGRTRCGLPESRDPHRYVSRTWSNTSTYV